MDCKFECWIKKLFFFIVNIVDGFDYYCCGGIGNLDVGVVGVEDDGCYNWVKCCDLYNFLVWVLRVVDFCSKFLIYFIF